VRGVRHQSARRSRQASLEAPRLPCARGGVGLAVLAGDAIARVLK
jgi:hypothetical protein